jgi:hypothetical protein
VDESDQGGTDLNGDGDTKDEVYHVVDRLTGTVTNLGLAFFFPPRLDADAMLFQVVELGQGQDLNGDGDWLDRVVHFVSFDSPTPLNLGLAVDNPTGFSGDDSLWSFRVSEFAQGVDLDGDGLLNSHVPHVYDSDTGTLVNLAGQGIEPYSISGGRMVVTRAEAVFGMDLNGDGDLLDDVQELKDASLATILRSGLAASPLDDSGFGLGAADAYVLGPQRWFPDVYEVYQGTDLNGDGDQFDTVSHLVDLDTGGVTNLGVHLVAFTGILMDLLAAEGPVTSRVGWVYEPSLGGQDLNGDGDGFDRVLHEWEAPAGTLKNLGIAVRSSHATNSASLLLFLVGELEQGVDLDGDGDLLDDVWHVYEPAQDRLVNLRGGIEGGLSWQPLAFGAGEDFVVFEVSEAATGGIDLNGDGDASDDVLHHFDATAGTITNLGLAVGLTDQLTGRRFTFDVSEAAQGGVDLNADGDTNDRVLHFFDVP